MLHSQEKIGKNFWNEVDKNRLEVAYQAGISLKEISTLLGRTYQSINKALDRSKIREKAKVDIFFRCRKSRTKIHKKTLYEVQQDPDIWLLLQKRVQYSIGKKGSNSRRNLHKVDLWTHMDIVLEFLRSRGFDVRKPLVYVENIEPIYFLNGKPSTGLSVLLLANRLRILDHKQPFLVSGVTQ